MFLRAITEEGYGNGRMLLFPFICVVIYYLLLFYFKLIISFYFLLYKCIFTVAFVS